MVLTDEGPRRLEEEELNTPEETEESNEDNT